MTPEEEAKANALGDKLAQDVLGLREATQWSPDSMGRKRWYLPDGNKTGLGLLRTIERFAEEQIAIIDGEPPPDDEETTTTRHEACLPIGCITNNGKLVTKA